MNLKIAKNNKGFTILELMIAMVIFVVVVALIADNYGSQQDQHVTQNQVVEIQQNVRAGFHMIITEIRMAGFDPYGSYGAAITAAGDGTNAFPLSFTYVADTDCIDNDNDNPNPDSCGDANVDETGELKTVTINLFDSSIDSGTSLDEVQIDAAGQPIAENIAALEFLYFDEDGIEIALVSNTIPTDRISDIRAIEVTLTARPDESERDLMADSGGSNRTLVSMIKCRNL